MFQSTPPIREETRQLTGSSRHRQVSIHSSHTGGDIIPEHRVHLTKCFNPLLPYGRRLSMGAFIPARQCFNPLLPYGRRPYEAARKAEMEEFQSTPPIREETLYLNIMRFVKSFQSTPPIREETVCVLKCSRNLSVSIHSSHTGGDLRIFVLSTFFKMFQSTPPIREET